MARGSPAVFVQRFYDSYLKKDAPHWPRTVRNQRALFASSLADALQEDAAAQAKVSGDIVGLDFDPFLGSQDPGPKFAARRPTAIQGGFQVEVHDLAYPGKPMVLVDIAPKDGSWVITDFHYPGMPDDLRAILKALRRDR